MGSEEPNEPTERAAEGSALEALGAHLCRLSVNGEHRGCVGAPARGAFHSRGDLDPELREALRRAAAGAREVVLRGVPEGGSFEHHLAPDPAGAVCLVLDVTRREQNTRRAQADRLEQLLTTLAHDLNGFLGPVALRASMLHGRAGADAERVERAASAISAGSEAIDRFLRRLVPPSPARRAPVDLGALLRAAAARLAETWPDARVELHVEPDAPAALGDRETLLQAMIELLANAAEASQGEHIQIAVRPERAERPQGAGADGLAGSSVWALVVIRDSGPGMRPAALDRLDWPLLSDRAELGRGVGLWRASRIVAGHGGELAARSGPAGGLEVQLRLPADGAPRASASASAPGS